MLFEKTLEKLQTLKMDALAHACVEQQKDPELLKLSFEERLSMAVDVQWLHRENNRLARLLSEAKLRISSACIESLDFSARRELDKNQVKQLATCRWVTEHQSIIITGMTGTGKTYLACALAQAVCRQGFRVAYKRAPRLFTELSLAHADGTYHAYLKRLARMDVLVIDDWGLSTPKDQDRRDLLEILEDRHGLKSTIMTSQLPTDKWHDFLGDPTIADAICDRVLNNAHRLVLKGPSKRKEASSNN